MARGSSAKRPSGVRCHNARRHRPRHRLELALDVPWSRRIPLHRRSERVRSSLGAAPRRCAQLIGAAEAEARERGLHALVAVIDVEHTASIALFSGAGYQERGRLPEIGWKFGERRDEVFMVKLI